MQSESQSALHMDWKYMKHFSKFIRSSRWAKSLYICRIDKICSARIVKWDRKKNQKCREVCEHHGIEFKFEIRELNALFPLGTYMHLHVRLRVSVRLFLRIFCSIMIKLRYFAATLKICMMRLCVAAISCNHKQTLTKIKLEHFHKQHTAHIWSCERTGEIENRNGWIEWVHIKSIQDTALIVCNSGSGSKSSRAPSWIESTFFG